MEHQIRYLGVELISECPHCGNPLLLNGPLRAPTCTSCHRIVQIPERVMHRALVYYGDAFDAPGKTYGPHTEMPSGFTFRHTLTVATPRCVKCKAALPCDDIGTGTNGSASCPSCGTLFDTFPTPEWLTKMFPEFTQVFLGARDRFTALPNGTAPNLNPEPGKDAGPVLMQCPQCSGSLTINHESRRLTSCTFCQSEFYLPDAIWNRLHPVSTVQKWFLRVEGPTSNEQARATKKAREEAERREEQEAAKAREAYAKREKENRAQQAVAALAQIKIYNWLLPLPFILHAVVLALCVTAFKSNGTLFGVGIGASITLEGGLFFWGNLKYHLLLHNVDERLVEPTKFNSDFWAMAGVVPLVGIITTVIGFRTYRRIFTENLRRRGYGDLGITVGRPYGVFIFMGVTLLHLLIIATIAIKLPLLS